MRGRDIYRRLKPGFDLGTGLLRSAPRTVREATLASFRSTPGPLGLALRYMAVKSLARSCGENVFVGQYAWLSFLENIEIGNNVSIREFCNIGGQGGLIIGNDVSLAHGTSVLTTEHDWRQTEQPIRDAPGVAKPTRIGDDVWVGAHCLITAGVEIGSGAVVGGGSVVTKSVPAGAVVVGVPARVIRDRASE